MRVVYQYRPRSLLACVRLFEAQRREAAWQTYMADSLWILATGRKAARADGTPAYDSFSDLMNGTAHVQRDTRTAEQIKADLLAKLDGLAGEENV